MGKSSTFALFPLLLVDVFFRQFFATHSPYHIMECNWNVIRDCWTSLLPTKVFIEQPTYRVVPSWWLMPGHALQSSILSALEYTKRLSANTFEEINFQYKSSSRSHANLQAMANRHKVRSWLCKYSLKSLLRRNCIQLQLTVCHSTSHNYSYNKLDVIDQQYRIRISITSDWCTNA